MALPRDGGGGGGGRGGVAKGGGRGGGRGGWQREWQRGVAEGGGKICYRAAFTLSFEQIRQKARLSFFAKDTVFGSINPHKTSQRKPLNYQLIVDFLN